MKNPWLGMWLSAANGWLGAARGVAMAEARRQQRRMIEEATAQTTRLWREALTGRTKPEPKRRSRRADKRSAPS